MNLNTEIRKLSPGDLYNLVQILEYDESWKKLMAVIPKRLTLDNYDCKISSDNFPKYSTDHFKLIDTAGLTQRRPCAEILLDEWGTSGRIRPRLGHLISLLKKTELFRAADYVAMDLLKMPEVDRPASGPAAKINIPLDEQLRNPSPQISNNYPSSILDGDAIPSAILNELMHPRPQHVIPTIIINGVDDENANINIPEIQDIYVEKKINVLDEQLSEENLSNEENISNNMPALSTLLENNSNLIKFDTSRSELKNEVADQNIETPDVSKILNNGQLSQDESVTANNLPDFSNIIPNSSAESQNQNLSYSPHFSNILNNSESDQSSNHNSNNLPHFSIIMNSNSSNNSQAPLLSQTPNPNSHSDNLPDLSNIMISNSNSQNSQKSFLSYTPDFSNILKSENIEKMAQTESINLPNLSIINGNTTADMQNHMSDYTPAFSNIMDTNNGGKENIPAFSQILNSDTIAPDCEKENIPAFSQILNSDSSSPNSVMSSSEIPHFTELLLNNEKSVSSPLNLPVLNDLLGTSPSPSVQSSNSRTCASPLPNLLLKTVLPHYTYQELEQCTENFDETILSTQDSCNLNQAARFGRKLGSGAFGSVYLGIGLLDKPVAVKKLNLNGVNVVNVDDTITKQFRNEVELLCKYKHENLLSLLGYSCDGPTYCLIYEYICGGALKDRLQGSLKSPEQFRLLWTDRLYIALGTAKAVAYLHNAYSMPLIHRDIKSANILLDSVNKPKLCDFGLIKLTPNQNTNTSTTVFGTSAYMAPEAFRGDVSVKLDTFSFGVVLLELLTSLPPLDENREGNDLVTHVEEVCEDDIKPLLDMNAGSWVVNETHFGDAIYEITTQCLEEKKRRPLMSAVVKQLTELIDKSVPE